MAWRAAVIPREGCSEPQGGLVVHHAGDGY